MSATLNFSFNFRLSKLLIFYRLTACSIAASLATNIKGFLCPSSGIIDLPTASCSQELPLQCDCDRAFEVTILDSDGRERNR